MISNRENDSAQNSHLRKDVEHAHFDDLEHHASKESKDILHRKPYYFSRKDSENIGKNQNET